MRVLNLVTTPDAPFFVQQVTALERAGVETVTVGVPGERRDGAGVSRSPVDYLRFLPRAVRRSLGDVDVVHANYGLTAPAALACPRPVVVSLWGSDLYGRVGQLSRWCARRADATIVMSEAMADRLGTPATVVPHGVDRRLFRPFPTAPARRAVGWHADAAHVLFPYPPEQAVKNYPRAERVVERARARVDGPVELHTLSGVPHARMPLYYNAADALLLTSEREGSPNAVKEALACALPVVATDVGDVRERLAGVDPSCVARTDADLVDGLVDALDRGGPSNGPAAVAPLGLDRMAERIRAVYERVCDGGDGECATAPAAPHER